MTGSIQDLAGNVIDPDDLNISSGNDTYADLAIPVASVDHYPPRALDTTIRIPSSALSGSNPDESIIYPFNSTFIFTVSFHEDLSLLGHEDDLANLELALDFDSESTDRTIPLGTIPTSSRNTLLFTYVVENGDQAKATATDADGSITGT